MRTFAFFILTIFSFQILDVPPLGAYQPKTCCGRAVCMCHHAVGAPCRFRLTGDDDPASANEGGMHAHCKLAKKTSTADGLRFLTQAPCHTESPKTTFAGTTRDYESVVKTGVSFNPVSRFLDLPQITFPLSTASLGIERPPRAF